MACHVLAEDRARNPDVVVTDVSGVKVPVVDAVRDPRFVGGHPMAGSEQSGDRRAPTPTSSSAPRGC